MVSVARPSTIRPVRQLVQLGGPDAGRIAIEGLRRDRPIPALDVATERVHRMSPEAR
jgi:hypothetical protein